MKKDGKWNGQFKYKTDGCLEERDKKKESK
jgi:hypothetical protein